MAYFKHETIGCYSIAIDAQLFISLVFNSTIRRDLGISDRFDPGAGD